MNSGISSMNTTRRNIPNLDLTCNVALEMLHLLCSTLIAIVPRIMVHISHFSSSQCNVIVKYRSFVTEGHMSHVNKTSVSTQNCDTVQHMDFTASSSYSSTALAALPQLICGYLGSTVLMKTVKPVAPQGAMTNSPMYTFLQGLSHAL